MRKDPSNPKYIKVEAKIGPIIKEVIRMEAVGQTVETEDNMEIIDLGKTIETTIFKGITRGYRRQNSRGEHGDTRCNDYSRSRNRPRERTFSRNYDSNRDRSSSNSRLRSWSRSSTNRDRIRCYNCREYNHFVRNCPKLQRRKRPRAIATNAEYGSQETNSFVD